MVYNGALDLHSYKGEGVTSQLRCMITLKFWQPPLTLNCSSMLLGSYAFQMVEDWVVDSMSFELAVVYNYCLKVFYESMYNKNL